MERCFGVRLADWVRVVSMCVMVVITASLLTSCVASKRQRRPYLVMENMDNAARHLEQGQEEEAAQIYQTVLFADPSNEEAEANLDDIGSYDRCIMKPSPLGLNLVRKPKREGAALWIALYPFNRIMDILDIFTLEVGPQGGVYASAHATRALNLGAGAAGGAYVGWDQKRDLSVGSGHIAGFSILPFSCKGQGVSKVGTYGSGSESFSTVGLNQPSDFMYQRYVDYWGFGGRVVALIIGVRAEVHPVEVIDALSSFLFVDFLRDDWGHTRRLSLNAADLEAMEALMKTLSPDELRKRMRGRSIPSVKRPSTPERSSQ